MPTTFEEWLISQQNREDDIGHLARALAQLDIQQKSSKRKPDEHKYWVDAVTRISEPGHIHAFNYAWQEYLQAKQAASPE